MGSPFFPTELGRIATNHMTTWLAADLTGTGTNTDTGTNTGPNTDTGTV